MFDINVSGLNFWNHDWFCQTTNPEQYLWVLDTCLTVKSVSLIIILITISSSTETYSIWSYFFGVPCGVWSSATRFPVTPLDLLIWFDGESYTIIIKCQRSRVSIPSMRKPVSRETTSASVELYESNVWFLQMQLKDTNVWLPKILKTLSDIHFDSSMSPVRYES